MARIGDPGVTATPLTPGGFVTIDGDRFPARCESGYLEVSQTIIVIDGDNLGLIVRGWDFSVEQGELQRHGEIVFASFGAKIKSLGAAAEAHRAARVRTASRKSIRLGGFAGFLTGVLLTIWTVLDSEFALNVPTILTSLSAILGCTVWGVIIGRVLWGMFERMGETKLRVLASSTIIVTMLGAGGTFGLVSRHHSLTVSLCAALCATVVSGCSLLALVLVGEWLSGDDADNGASGDASGPNL